MSIEWNPEVSRRLRTGGYARVAVVLKDRERAPVAGSAQVLSAPPTDSIRSVQNCFTRKMPQPRGRRVAGQPRALGLVAAATTPPPRVFPRLGIAIGVLESDAVPDLQRQDNVAKVLMIPVLSLVAPVGLGLRSSVPPSGPAWGLQQLASTPLCAARAWTGGASRSYIWTPAYARAIRLSERAASSSWNSIPTAIVWRVGAPVTATPVSITARIRLASWWVA